jgi:hypothetical protein
MPFQNPSWAYDSDSSSYASLMVEGYSSTIYDYFIFSENLSVTAVTLSVLVSGVLSSGFNEALGREIYATHALAYTFGTTYSTALYSYSSQFLWSFGSATWVTYNLVVPAGANLNTLKVRFFTSAKPGDAGENAIAEVYVYDLYASAGSGGGTPSPTNVSGKRILRCRPT